MKKNSVISYFDLICSIPHTSGNEKKLSDEVVKILENAGAKVIQYPNGNVYAYKPNNINLSGICFQAHLDMVPQKSDSSKHDFINDPIQYREENGWLVTNGTTLGADNGIGVAMILSMFNDENINNPLEAILTIEEETTFKGALSLPQNLIKSKYFINLDSEQDDLIVIGSGGTNVFEAYIPSEWIDSCDSMFGVKIKISGGLGGHSGVVIGETRINALVESLNILKTLADKYNFNIVEIKTQNPANAIPDRVEVILDVNKNQNDAFFKDYTDLFNEMKKSYQLEKNIELEITSNINQKSLTHNVTTKILNLIIGSFSGLNKYDFRFDIPEASSNLSSINISEDQIKMHWFSRANNEYFLNNIKNKLVSIAKLGNIEYNTHNKSSPWMPLYDNELALYIIKIAKEKFNKDIKMSAIHAGLEVGEICKNNPNIIGVSIGPNIINPHSPREAVELKSVDFIYNLVLESIKNLK